MSCVDGGTQTVPSYQRDGSCWTDLPSWTHSSYVYPTGTSKGLLWVSRVHVSRREGTRSGDPFRGLRRAKPTSDSHHGPSTLSRRLYRATAED